MVYAHKELILRNHLFSLVMLFVMWYVIFFYSNTNVHTSFLQKPFVALKPNQAQMALGGTSTDFECFAIFICCVCVVVCLLAWFVFVVLLCQLRNLNWLPPQNIFIFY